MMSDGMTSTEPMPNGSITRGDEPQSFLTLRRFQFSLTRSSPMTSTKAVLETAIFSPHCQFWQRSRTESLDCSKQQKSMNMAFTVSKYVRMESGVTSSLTTTSHAKRTALLPFLKLRETNCGCFCWRRLGPSCMAPMKG